MQAMFFTKKELQLIQSDLLFTLSRYHKRQGLECDKWPMCPNDHFALPPSASNARKHILALIKEELKDD
jgi:hypothetical protein